MGEDIEKYDENQEVEVYLPGEPPMSFLRCSTCYIGIKCPGFNLSAEGCALKELRKEIDVYSPGGVQDLVLTALALQAERVFRMAAYEELDGGLADPRVSQEIKLLMQMMETIKKLGTKDEFQFFMKVKGQGAEGVFNKMFGSKEE